ncbi:hypothetical protein EW026_g4144 [Hermanssonia centrifuga]|uniref:PLD phosphodiesterase domain-containing protein n=1 Tax=Hermanssonia centrifuga TaxID=98765 RepID=A0A4S4KIE1_9APHY|nr:hypothetical protein EW026_g4144 [Hermanssonia centrifuga]
MPSEAIYKLVTSGKTVTAAMEQDPTQVIDDVAHNVFPEKAQKATKSKKVRTHDDFTEEDLNRAEQCAKFPYRPSDLFLKMYCNVLDTLERGPLKNMCSPPLMGSSGVIPITVISLVPDIMRYYKDLIIDAQHEVVLATNYWEPSWGAHFIHDAFIELSKRSEDRPNKPVVKLIFDRGNPKQIYKNHQKVAEEEWGALGLPTRDQIPNIHFQAMNYHRPIVGTFHAKYMVIDRRVACVSSNNIQDRVNLEMNIQLEGPIVEAFYDMALLSWAEDMNPPLPLLSNPKAPVSENGRSCFEEARAQDMDNTSSSALPAHPDPDSPESKKPMTDFTLINAKGFYPFVLHEPHDLVPIAMVNRAPHGTPGHGDVDVPQNVAWLSGIQLAKKSVFIQTPDFNAEPVVAAILDACRRDVECTLYVCLGYNDQGEMLPMQGGTNSKIFASMCDTLNKEGQGKRKFLKACWYTAKDRDRPIDAAAKERNCHVKFCCIDGQVAIAGNGNQDTQSWFHSQECNIMVDSPKLCAEWMAALNNNQNTAMLGPIGEDGLWRDKDGNVVQSSGGLGGPVEVMKGMMNAVARVQGKGGF